MCNNTKYILFSNNSVEFSVLARSRHISDIENHGLRELPCQCLCQAAYFRGVECIQLNIVSCRNAQLHKNTSLRSKFRYTKSLNTAGRPTLNNLLFYPPHSSTANRLNTGERFLPLKPLLFPHV